MNSSKPKEILPVSLMTEGRDCLVVGGGKVAARKVQNLLDAGANVTVVSPKLNDAIPSADINHVKRNFRNSDLDGIFLVFAATNDKKTNKAVIQECNARNILCCSVDGNWTIGDFVTPATFRNSELTVSIATGGRSCRQARLVKDNLARHIEMVESADLIVLGTSHNYLPLEKREPFHLVGPAMEQTGQMLMHVWGIHEFMLINTCNRIELAAVISKEAAVDELLKRIMAFFHLQPHEYYCKRGFDAFQHMSILSAGLLSQTPGENHIVAQVKESLDHAMNSGWAAGMMQEWISSALHVSKAIRKKTRPLLKNYEIEDLCMDYLESEAKDLKNNNIMVLGAGTIGAEVIECLVKRGLKSKWCYHVNKPEMKEFWKKKISLCTFNDMRDKLSDTDIIICATTSQGHVLHQGHAPFFDQERNVLIVDLAIPRNVAPELNELTPKIHVVDLDDLKHWFRRELADMTKILEISRNTAADNKNLYDKIIKSFQTGNKG